MGPRGLFTFVPPLGLRAAFLLQDRLATCHLKFREFFSATIYSPIEKVPFRGSLSLMFKVRYLADPTVVCIGSCVFGVWLGRKGIPHGRG